MVVKSGRASQGSAEPQLIYSPKRRKGGRGEGVDRGMDRNAYRGGETIYFTAAEGGYSGFVCIFSLDWSTVDMLLM